MLQGIGIILLLLSMMFVDGAIVVAMAIAAIGVGLIWLGKGFDNEEADAKR